MYQLYSTSELNSRLGSTSPRSEQNLFYDFKYFNDTMPLAIQWHYQSLTLSYTVQLFSRHSNSILTYFSRLINPPQYNSCMSALHHTSIRDILNDLVVIKRVLKVRFIAKKALNNFSSNQFKLPLRVQFINYRFCNLQNVTKFNQ